MSRQEQPGFRFTGRHMLASVVGFFAVVIGVNCAMAYAAVSTFPGLNAHNGYVASQTYNALLKDAAAQDALGWKSRLSVCDGRLMLTLEDMAGAPIHDLAVTALVGRPATAAQDREVAMMPVEDGFVTSDRLAPGRWLVSIEAVRGDAVVWRSTRPIIVQKGG